MPGKVKNTQVSVAGHIEPQVNRYYIKVSRRYLAVGIVFMLVLLLYIGAVTVFLGDYVTYDNLKYLARDFEAMTLSGNDEFTKIVYNGTDNTTFAYFRNGLAVCSGDNYSYYDTSGGVLVNDKVSYANPAVASSEKYLLTYGVGGKEYSIYNQLTEIISRTTEGEIIAGDVSDEGAFVIVERSREARYVVELYNSSFTKVMNVYKENYILDVAVSPDGKHIVICSAVPTDTDFNCELEICRRGSSEPVSINTYEQTMPLSLYAMSEHFIMLCDNGIYIIGYDGTIKDGMSFTGMSLKYADIGEATCAVVCTTNPLGNEYKVVVFDSATGDTHYDKTLNYRISGIYASVNSKDALAYITTPESVIKIAPNGEFEVHTSTSRALAVVPIKKGALVCAENSAYPIFD